MSKLENVLFRDFEILSICLLCYKQRNIELLKIAFEIPNFVPEREHQSSKWTSLFGHVFIKGAFLVYRRERDKCHKNLT